MSRSVHVVSRRCRDGAEMLPKCCRGVSTQPRLRGVDYDKSFILHYYHIILHGFLTKLLYNFKTTFHICSNVTFNFV